MDSLELDADAFYICTEVSPRNYVVQKAIQIDKSQIERMVGDLEKNAAAAAAAATSSSASGGGPGGGAGNSVSQPPPPPLPYWFTRECKEKLMKVEFPPPGSFATSSSHMFIPTNFTQMPPVDIKQQLKNQLEYYFSRENLMTDRYLRCQMDSEQYVPITVIAGFRKIVQLTNDYEMIVQALRESNLVEVDEKGEKVRPITKRTTIILREVGQEHKHEVEKMLAGGPAYLDLKYGLNDSWYVTYETEEQTQDAYIHLQGIEIMFNNRPICARIKAGGPPAHLDHQHHQLLQSSPMPTEPTSSSSGQEAVGFPPMMDLGHVLSAYGFIPVATYRPGSTVVHVEEETPIVVTKPQQPQQFKYNNNNGWQNSQKMGGKERGGANLKGNGILPTPSMVVASQPTREVEQKTYSSTTNSNSNSNSWKKNNERNFRRNGGVSSSSNTTTSQYSAPQQQQQQYHPANIPAGPAPPAVPNPQLNTSKYPPLNVSSSSSTSATTMDQKPTTAWNNSPTMMMRSDLPSPPIWPAPRHHIVQQQNQNQQNQPRKESTMTSEAVQHQPSKDSRDEMDGNVTPTPAETTSSQSGTTIDSCYSANNRKQSTTQSIASSSYSYEEQAFPCLPKPPVEPEKRVEKPTFSSVAAGRRNIKQIPEAKKSYAEKLKEKTLKS